MWMHSLTIYNSKSNEISVNLDARLHMFVENRMYSNAWWQWEWGGYSEDVKLRFVIIKGVRKALRAFEQEGIFIVPRLLWHVASVFPVSIQSPLTTHEGMWRIYSNRDPHGDRQYEKMDQKMRPKKKKNFLEWISALSANHNVLKSDFWS